MESVVIFCSSSSEAAPEYNQCAARLVEGLCAKGYGIVSGGSFRGTMGAVADAAVRSGGHHKGVLPRFMQRFVYEGLSETAWTDTMSQRKEEMRKGTVAAIALPGGIGTLDEIIETLVLKKLGQYHGRVIVLGPGAFFDPFLALLDHFVATGMFAPEDRALLECYDSADALLATFNTAQ